MTPSLGRTSLPSGFDFYRFVGFCDDILPVRINERTVLDGCLTSVDNELQPRQKQYPTLIYEPIDPVDADLWVGIPVQLQVGEQVAIEILIGAESRGWSN
jgi:hypothetical protein